MANQAVACFLQCEDLVRLVAEFSPKGDILSFALVCKSMYYGALASSHGVKGAPWKFLSSLRLAVCSLPRLLWIVRDETLLRQMYHPYWLPSMQCSQDNNKMTPSEVYRQVELTATAMQPYLTSDTVRTDFFMWIKSGYDSGDLFHKPCAYGDVHLLQVVSQSPMSGCFKDRFWAAKHCGIAAENGRIQMVKWFFEYWVLGEQSRSFLEQNLAPTKGPRMQSFLRTVCIHAVRGGQGRILDYMLSVTDDDTRTWVYSRNLLEAIRNDDLMMFERIFNIITGRAEDCVQKRRGAYPFFDVDRAVYTAAKFKARNTGRLLACHLIWHKTGRNPPVNMDMLTGMVILGSKPLLFEMFRGAILGGDYAMARKLISCRHHQFLNSSNYTSVLLESIHSDKVESVQFLLDLEEQRFQVWFDLIYPLHWDKLVQVCVDTNNLKTYNLCVQKLISRRNLPLQAVGQHYQASCGDVFQKVSLSQVCESCAKGNVNSFMCINVYENSTPRGQELYYVWMPDMAQETISVPFEQGVQIMEAACSSGKLEMVQAVWERWQESKELGRAVPRFLTLDSVKRNRAIADWMIDRLENPTVRFFGNKHL